MSRRLYSLEPLADALGCTLGQLGRRLGVSGSTWQQYRSEGVSELVADRLAVKAGLHPALVWPELVEFAITEVEHIDYIRVMSDRAKNRDRKAAERRHNARTQEREAEYRRAYRASLSDAARAQQLRAARAYKAAHADEIAKKDRDYKDDNRQRRIEYQRAYYQRTRAQRLAWQRENDRQRRRKVSLPGAMVA
jgi:hypothetical protein